jgi:hypothetical protein
VATWAESSQEIETGIMSEELNSNSNNNNKYKVFCDDCDWHAYAGSIIEVQHIESKHYIENKCLGARHQRIA